MFILFLISIHIVNVLSNNYCALSCNYNDVNYTHTVCERKLEKCGPHDNCGPDFKIPKLNDQQRQYIVDLHNYLRQNVASGNERRGGEQPPASNMNIMTYNKELEYIAQCWANACNGAPLIHDRCRRTNNFANVGQNLGFINSSISNINIYKSLKQLIVLWYDEVAIFNKKWVTNTQNRGPNYKVGHYTQMMWAETTEIGCALSFYTTKSVINHKWHHLILVCNYGPAGNYLGLPVYRIGKPASECPKNTKPNSSYTALCGKIKSINRSIPDSIVTFDNLI